MTMASGKMVVMLPGDEPPKTVDWTTDPSHAQGREKRPPIKLMMEYLGGFPMKISEAILYNGKLRNVFINGDEEPLTNVVVNAQASRLCGFPIVGPLIISIPA